MDSNNEDSMSPSETTSSAEDEANPPSLPLNPCRICPFVTYVTDPKKDKMCQLGKTGAKSCTEWAKERNMDIVFKVFKLLYRIVLYPFLF